MSVLQPRYAGGAGGVMARVRVGQGVGTSPGGGNVEWDRSALEARKRELRSLGEDAHLVSAALGSRTLARIGKGGSGSDEAEGGEEGAWCSGAGSRA